MTTPEPKPNLNGTGSHEDPRPDVDPLVEAFCEEVLEARRRAEARKPADGSLPDVTVVTQQPQQPEPKL